MPYDVSFAAPSETAPSRAALQGLAVRNDAAAALRIASHFGAILLVGLGIGLVVFHFGLIWALPLMVAQGWLIAFLFMPLHETAHKTAFASGWANGLVGRICAAAIVWPYEYYILFHWAHHRHTQDPERDPELVSGIAPPTSTSGLLILFSGVRLVLRRGGLLLRHALTGRVDAPWVPAGKRQLVVREARWMAALYVAAIFASLLSGSAMLLWVWFAPLMIGQAFLRPYLLAEHSACGHTRDAFENTRTTFTSGLVRWFTWNMPYHTEHHAYPNVPFHALPRLHDLVEGRLQHRGPGYLAVTRQVWRWFRQGAA